VLRRLLRRAARHGKLLGLDRPFLHEVVGAVVQAMGRAYPEVVQQHRRIAEVVRGEEERFAATLDRGLALLAGEVEKARAAKARGPVRAGTTVDVVTAETPFYAESGGQVSDRGWLETGAGAKVEVTDTQKLAPAVIAHRGVVREGELAVGDRVHLRIDAARRDAARLNHSATHLLHAALRRRLGEHVKQAGSLVTPERLRFDFSHHRPVDDGTLRDIEDETNAYIRANAEVTAEEMAYDDAIKAGGPALLLRQDGHRRSVVALG